MRRMKKNEVMPMYTMSETTFPTYATIIKSKP